MAVVSLIINAKDTATGTIQNVSNSLSKLTNTANLTKTAFKNMSGGFNNVLNITRGLAGGVLNVVGDIARGIGQTLKKNEDYKNSIETINKTFNTLSNVAIKLLMPTFKTITDAISKFLKSSEGIKNLGNIFGGLAASLTLVKNIFNIFKDVLKDALKPVFNAISNFSKLTGETDGLTNALNFLKPILTGLAIGFSVVGGVIGFVIKFVINLIDVIKNAGKVIGSFFEALMTGNWKNFNEILKNTGDSFKNIVGDMKEGFVDIVKNAVETGKKFDNSFDTSKIAKKMKEDFENAKNQTTEALNNMNNEIEEKVKYDKILEEKYERYLEIKQKLQDKDKLTQQQYFDYLDELAKIQEDKRIAMLDDYYKKNEETTEKIKTVWDLLKENNLASLSSFLKAGEGILNEMINNINKAVAEGVGNLSKSIANLKTVWEDFKNKMADIKDVVNAVLQVVASGFQILGAISNSIVDGIFGYFKKESENAINEINKKYDNFFKNIEKQLENNLSDLENWYKSQLDLIERNGLSEIEYEKQKLEELKNLKENFLDEETELRLQMLDDYYSKIDEQTDYDIKMAYERQRAKILETEQKKKKDLEEQISAQQTAVKKLQLQEEYEKKKKEIEEKARKQKEEAEKKKNKELDEAERQAFELNKANQIANVWISTAVGVATAWASAMQLGPIAGPIMAGILTGVLLTNAGVQTGLIASQNYISKYATGGRVNETGNYLVGETGAEIVRLPRGAYVENNDKTNQILNANNENIEINLFLDSELVIQKIIEKRRKTELSFNF
ncbi:MAG: hypothetical protein GYA62_12800 [Bacteroidales bacterium]|nr:hypothetical protein [Bacteroidales bacterium]